MTKSIVIEAFSSWEDSDFPKSLIEKIRVLETSLAPNRTRIGHTRKFADQVLLQVYLGSRTELQVPIFVSGCIWSIVVRFDDAVVVFFDPSLNESVSINITNEDLQLVAEDVLSVETLQDLLHPGRLSERLSSQQRTTDGQNR